MKPSLRQLICLAGILCTAYAAAAGADVNLPRVDPQLEKVLADCARANIGWKAWNTRCVAYIQSPKALTP